MTKDKV